MDRKPGVEALVKLGGGGGGVTYVHGVLPALVETMGRILSHHALEGNREKPCQYLL